MYSFKINLIQFNISELVENYDFIKPDDKPIAPGNFFLHIVIWQINHLSSPGFLQPGL